jgi:AcrR family transcriptional regulator
MSLRLPLVPRDNHRQRLLDGALECLKTRGYAQTTTRDIARAADANVGSIGYHFGSKEALLNEAMQEGFLAWTEQLGARVSGVAASDPLERLRLTWDAMVGAFEEQEGLMNSFLEALPAATRSPQLRGQLAGLYRDTRAAIAERIEESLGNDPGTAHVIASLLLAMTDGLMLQWFLEPAQTPDGDDIATAFTRAISAGAPGASST